MKGPRLFRALLAALLLIEAGCQSWCEHRYPCPQQACGPPPCCPAPAYQPAPSYAPPVQQLQPVPVYQGAPQGYPCTPCPCTPTH